ncbi:MAG: hypothetical protein RL757_1283 [Bacteroidota bacterium]|jgi:hypothetical protein
MFYNFNTIFFTALFLQKNPIFKKTFQKLQKYFFLRFSFRKKALLLRRIFQENGVEKAKNSPPPV